LKTGLSDAYLIESLPHAASPWLSPLHMQALPLPGDVFLLAHKKRRSRLPAEDRTTPEGRIINAGLRRRKGRVATKGCDCHPPSLPRG